LLVVKFYGGCKSVLRRSTTALRIATFVSCRAAIIRMRSEHIRRGAHTYYWLDRLGMERIASIPLNF